MFVLLLAAAAGFLAGTLLERTPRGRWRRWSVGAAATGAAIGAAAAHTAPTGSVPLDTVLRAAFAAGCCLLASRARQPWLIAAGIAGLGGAVVAGPHHLDAVVLAGTGAGMAAARLSTEPSERRTSVPGAAAAALLVNAACRYSHPHPLGLTLLLGILVTGPLLVGGGLRLARRPHRRKHIALALGAAGVVVAALAVIGFFGALKARPDLERGVQLAQAGLAAARNDQTAASAADLQQAAVSFDRGNRYLRLAAPALALPGVAQQVRALRALGFSGRRLAAEGAQTLGTADLAGLHLSDGTLPLDRVAALEAPLRQAGSTLRLTAAALTKAHSPWLMPAVSNRLDRLTGKVSRAVNDDAVALDAVRVVPDLLGAHGPRRYLLVVETPSEMRGTGGLIGNYAEISAVNGHLSLDRRGRATDLNAALASQGPAVNLAAVAPDYEARYGRFKPQLEWRNVTLSPDFPTVASVIEKLYPVSGGDQVDGVISIDPIALTALLKVIGPVSVAGAPTGPAVGLTPANAAAELLHGQYDQFPRPERIDFLDLVVQSVWNRIGAGALPPVPDLVRALAPSMRGKHLMMAGTHPDEQSFFHRIDLDGAMAPVRGDYVGLVTQNAGGNKIDWYLSRSLDYRVRVDPSDGLLHGSLDIVLRNAAPASGESPVVINGSEGSGTTPGQNKMYLSFYTPWQLAGATLDGTPLDLESAQELGRNVFSGFVTVPPRGSVTVRIEVVGKYTSPWPYHLDVFHQSTITLDQISVEVSKGSRQLAKARFASASDWTLTAPG